MSFYARGATAAFLFVLAAPAAAAPLHPNSGAMAMQGTAADNDGNKGEWSAEVALKDGSFPGTATIRIAGVELKAPLTRASYLENGRCVLKWEEGRGRMEIAGPCSSEALTGGVLSGFIPGVGSMTGRAEGKIRLAGGAAAKAPATGVLPTAKLTCAWMERVGGNVAGSLPNYELRFSNMGTLTLGADGTYRTASSQGRYVREAGRIRLTSGQFAGAVGRLQPDKSGRPGVFFERDENKRPNGVHIVDPQRTSCTVARGG